MHGTLRTESFLMNIDCDVSSKASRHFFTFYSAIICESSPLCRVQSAFNNICDCDVDIFLISLVSSRPGQSVFYPTKS